MAWKGNTWLLNRLLLCLCLFLSTVFLFPVRVQSLQRLALGLQPNMRIVLEHLARQMARNRFEDVVGYSHFRELGDDGVPQVMESQAWQAGGLPERAPGRVP